jgi:chemotaxis signal transduction protein
VTGQLFDWPAVHARLEALRQSLESGLEPSPEVARRILEGRAQKLAQVAVRSESASKGLDFLVFARAAERYAVEAFHVVEVLPFISLTPLPGARPFLVGVIHHRGNVIAVFDLRCLLLGTPGNFGAKREGYVVAVEVKGMSLGLLADGVSGIFRVVADELTAAGSPASRNGSPAWIRGTTADMVSVLNLDILARDPRITINED